MKINELRELLKDKRVIEEINKHLWIESQKVGYSIGVERATDEWLRLYAAGWMKYHEPRKYNRMMNKKAKRKVVKRAKVRLVKKRVAKNIVKKSLRGK